MDGDNPKAIQPFGTLLAEVSTEGSIASNENGSINANEIGTQARFSNVSIVGKAGMDPPSTSNDDSEMSIAPTLNNQSSRSGGNMNGGMYSNGSNTSSLDFSLPSNGSTQNTSNTRQDSNLMATLLASQAKGDIDSNLLTALLASQSNPQALAKLIASELEKSQTDSSMNSSSQYGSSNVSSNLGVTGLSLGSGLERLHVARDKAQQISAGVISKHDRGHTDYDRLKRKKIVCVALSDTLKCNDVIGIVTTDDLDKFDIASACGVWQTGLSGLRKRLLENDMLVPFMIPDEFDLSSGKVSGNFTNLLDDFKSISLETTIGWMKYLRKWALPVELESDLWTTSILEKSMDSELKQTVQEGIEELDYEARGGVTMFKLMVTEMVIVNQETVDQLHLWLRSFDLRMIDGQNVKVAGRQVRAIVRALDGYTLPENLIPTLLEGFSHSATEPFSNQCNMLSTMHRSTIMNFGNVNDSPKKTLFKILADLETSFASFAANRKWKGLDHNGHAFRVALSNTSLTALAARHQIPFDEWVKEKTCHNCGKKGHINKDCPDKKNNSRSDRRNEKSPPRGGRGQQHRRARKLFNAVMEQFGEESSGDEEIPQVHNTTVDEGNESDVSVESDSSMVERATAMFTGLLKE